MYKSGQIIFDDSINESVIFIEGEGEDANVVCTGVENKTAVSRMKDLKPIWNGDKMFFGKYVSKKFETIIEVNKANYKKYKDYILEIDKEITSNGKYHLKDG